MKGRRKVWKQNGKKHGKEIDTCTDRDRNDKERKKYRKPTGYECTAEKEQTMIIAAAKGQ